MNSSSSGSVPKHVLRLPKSRLYMSFSCLISSSIFAISGGAPTYHHTHPNSHNSSIIEYKTTTIENKTKKKKSRPYDNLCKLEEGEDSEDAKRS